MANNPAQELIKFGQSVWYDNISRDLLFSGEIRRLINEWGVRGMTSNPTIFESAISTGKSYDGQLLSLKSKNLTTDQLFEELAVQDIAAAADLLLPIYEQSGGDDGFMSIEVSPLLARETKGTVEEAKRLFSRLNRPNIMIKIPGTPEGIPAVRECLENGINVNITLLFSVENHVQVMETYCEALRARVARGLPVDKIRSVASFFVSRVDTIVDGKLDELAKKSNGSTAQLAESLKGKFGIANCKIAYKRFQEIFGAPFDDLRKAGAKPQRPLWASTSTKNPNYPDTIYVDNLIGPDTVNTMPHQTLEAVVDHGKCAQTLTANVAEAESVARQLTELGLDLSALMNQLQVEGVKKFSDSFSSLNETLKKKVG